VCAREHDDHGARSALDDRGDEALEASGAQTALLELLRLGEGRDDEDGVEVGGDELLAPLMVRRPATQHAEARQNLRHSLAASFEDHPITHGEGHCAGLGLGLDEAAVGAWGEQAVAAALDRGDSPEWPVGFEVQPRAQLARLEAEALLVGVDERWRHVETLPQRRSYAATAPSLRVTGSCGAGCPRVKKPSRGPRAPGCATPGLAPCVRAPDAARGCMRTLRCVGLAAALLGSAGCKLDSGRPARVPSPAEAACQRGWRAAEQPARACAASFRGSCFDDVRAACACASCRATCMVLESTPSALVACTGG
jgi:hypothetical protein